MSTLVTFILMLFACLLAVPIAVFFAEIIAAVALPRLNTAMGSTTPRSHLAVLIPAHNESAGLRPTLSDIQKQLFPGDRLVVIADNCSDDTAAVAQASGAEIIERHDLTRRGKGYALAYGIRHLSHNPPAVVIMIDADCRVDPGSIDQLGLNCAATGQPVQAMNIMVSPAKSSVNHQVAEFAGRVKQWLRPLGLSKLGLPCQMTGTGMAFPWDALRSVDLESGNITEDIKIGLQLSLAGYSPIFCEAARVRSEFPSSVKGAVTQRKRWEQGHIQTIVNDAPHMLSLAVVRHNWGLLVLTLDVIVPPLSLLLILTVGVFAVTAVAALVGFSWLPLATSAATLFVLAIAVFLAWLKCGRDVLPPRAFLSIISYVLGKLGLYGRIISGKADAKWDRTDREKIG